MGLSIKRINCIHLSNDTCKLASNLANTSIPTTDKVCSMCKQSDRPMALNIVTCSMAYSTTRDPRLLATLRQLHATDYVYTSKRNKPGTCLKAIFQELGISEGVSCQCDEYAVKMNGWGSEGCTIRIQEIIDHLNAQAYSWYDMVKAALGGYLTTRSLVEEAISRSI